MTEPHQTHGLSSIRRPIEFLVDPLKRLMSIEAADGGILLLAALAAMCDARD